MRVLVINSGSSSLKFALYDTMAERPALVVSGLVAGVGGDATLLLRPTGQLDRPRESRDIRDHFEAVRWMFERLKEWEPDRIVAVGHRVVHGGDRYGKPVRIDAAVLKDIEALGELAPLHNPPGLAAIRGAQRMLGGVPMVAVFDTAFHRTMPRRASTYAVPPEWATRHRVRRYGFHGIAHASLADGYATAHERPLAGTKLITLQLGNGCSAAAIADGRSIDTSMGFTPLEGLVMGTRSGDIDPAVVTYLSRREAVLPEVVENWLNQRAGLFGVSGVSNDMRQVVAAAEGGSAEAAFAVELFCYRAQKYIGAYLAALGGADAVIFGGGIGEHHAGIRAQICHDMAWCGLTVDRARNEQAVSLQPGEAARISSDDARLPAYVVGVDEERMIARETMKVIGEWG